MSDRRLTPFSGRVARDSLRGALAAPSFTPGEAATVCAALVDLCATPDGPRERQLLFGADLCIIERRGERAFVQAEADGYCGWVPAAALRTADANPGAGSGAPTHRVSARASHVYCHPSIKQGEVMALSLGARLRVLGLEGRFARIAEGFVPLVHLAPLDQPEADPVAVAERLLGTPYLWGGNSAFGIDCSGLVQLAFAACARACPGDSDLQWQGLGRELAAGTALRRGDLAFWRGHVALLSDAQRLVHANGQSMSVAHEPLEAALARMAAAGEGAFLGFRRPVCPPPGLTLPV